MMYSPSVWNAYGELGFSAARCTSADIATRKSKRHSIATTIASFTKPFSACATCSVRFAAIRKRRFCRSNMVDWPPPGGWQSIVPGVRAKALGLPHQNYKQTERGPLSRKRLKTRHVILAGLESLVTNDLPHLRVIMRNGGGDALDAVIAAVGVWRAWRQPTMRPWPGIAVIGTKERCTSNDASLN